MPEFKPQHGKERDRQRERERERERERLINGLISPRSSEEILIPSFLGGLFNSVSKELSCDI
jgi:hypothetical protein